MSKLKLKYIEGEFNTSLIDYLPDENGFVLNIEIGIGEEDKNRADTFSFHICDPRGLLDIVLNDTEFKDKQISSLADYHIFVMQHYNYENLLQYIDNILKKIPDQSSYEEKRKILDHYFSGEKE